MDLALAFGPDPSEPSSTSTPQADHPDRRQLRILAAASREFLDKGLEGANLDEIAATAGVGKATIYKFFRDKSDLFMHCVLRSVLDAVEPLREVLNPGLPLETVLRRIATMHIVRMTSPVIGERPFYEMVRALVGASITNPELARQCKQIFRNNLGIPLAAYFALKIEQGELTGDPGFLCEHFSQIIFFTNSVILEPESAPQPDQIDALAARTVAIFLNGCRARS
jgi:AcrR family transcriptional regulator